jgi:hypothetical protein
LWRLVDEQHRPDKALEALVERDDEPRVLGPQAVNQSQKDPAKVKL